MEKKESTEQQDKNEIKTEKINTEILERVQRQTNRVDYFNVLVDPSVEVPEQKKLTLMIQQLLVFQLHIMIF